MRGSGALVSMMAVLFTVLFGCLVLQAHCTDLCFATDEQCKEHCPLCDPECPPPPGV
ncbi:hypothetical protein ACP4OV_030697 [Aristida adscensionis]